MIPDTLKHLAVDINTLRPYPRNPRNGDIDAIAESLQFHNQYRPIVVRAKTNEILAGNHTYMAALQLGWPEIAATFVDVDDEEAARIVLVDNRLNEVARFDEGLLAGLLQDLPDLEGTGYDDQALADLLADMQRAEHTPLNGDPGPFDAPSSDTSSSPTLSERFVVPPFSVLDARQGYWQERKRYWLALGIKSELGRGENAAPGGSPRDAATLGSDGKTQRGDGAGAPINKNGLLGFSEQARGHYGAGARPASGLARSFGQDLMRGEHVVGSKSGDSRAIKDHAWLATHGKNRPQAGLTWVGGDRDYDDLDDVSRKNLAAQPQSGTSIFDPVLCELAYRWFCPPTGTILDPFAGGSVRGVVASKVGRQYVGIDLRAEQVDANRVQADTICADPMPVWHAGDSRDIAAICGDLDADLIFTCPPYYDLEVYSDDPADLSNVGDYGTFMALYREIIRLSVGRLRDDRFACVVVGDIRDKRGLYRNFVSDTISAFQAAGAMLYNEAILVTAVGSLPIRVGRQFASGRKLGKTHQNVLVFIKGDPRRAVEACGPVEVAVPDEPDGDSLLIHDGDGSADDPAAAFGEVLA